MRFSQRENASLPMRSPTNIMRLMMMRSPTNIMRLMMMRSPTNIMRLMMMRSPTNIMDPLDDAIGNSYLCRVEVWRHRQ
jgi:hypothetical protein